MSRPRLRRAVALIAAGGSIAGWMVGCAESPDSPIEYVPPPEEDGGPSARLPEAGQQTPRDASTSPKDSGGKEAGELDLGPPGPVGPKTGSACATPGEQFENTCGQCGVEIALCLEGKVGAYGPCRNEKVGANNCIPGQRSETACGYCGKKARTCKNDCTWVTGACKSEATNSDRCMPGTVDRRTADCEDGSKRTFTCTEACNWGTPTACTPGL